MQVESKIKISMVALEDISQILEIEKECFGTEAWSEEMFKYACIGKFGGIIKAEYEEKICGFLVYAILGGDEVNIDDIAVMPENRKKGIADAMMRYIFEKSEKSGIKKIMLEVRESNLPAIKLYEKYHMKKDGIRKNYYREPLENAILMSADIVK